MKLLPNHNALLKYFFLPIALITLALILFFNQYVIFVFRAHWLLLALAMLLVCTPYGKYKAHVEKRLPYWKCLLAVILLEIGSYYLFYSVILLDKHLFNTNIQQPLAFSNAYRQLMDWGIYPWALYALMAAILSYYSYVNKQIGLISITLQPLFDNSTEDSIGIYSDGIMRFSISFSIAYLISLTTLFMAAQLAYLQAITLHFGISLITLCFFILLVLCNKPYIWRSYLRLSSTLKFPFIVSISLFSLAMATIIILVNFIIGYCNLQFSSLSAPLFKLSLVQWQIHWQIFIALWWLCWLPLVSGFLALLFRGHSLRCLIVTVLLPLISYQLFLATFSSLPFLHFLVLIKPFAFLTAAIMIFIILGILLRQPYLTYIIRATLPKSVYIKIRRPNLFLANLLQASLLLTFCYLMAGILAINIISFILVVPVSIITLMTCIAFIKKIITK